MNTLTRYSIAQTQDQSLEITARTVFCLAFLMLVLLVPSSAQIPEGATLIEREKAKAEEVEGPRGSLGYRSGYGEENNQGRLLVRSLTLAGPADKAGLQENDVIYAFYGVGFKFRDDLERVEHFDGLLPGDRVEIQILRDEKPMTLEIIAKEMPLEQILEIEEFRAEAKYRRQNTTLLQVGRGGGVVLDVFHDPASGQLTYSAAGYPPATFQHMQLYVDTIPPLRDNLAEIPPGDHWGLEILKTGTRLDLNVLVDGAPTKKGEAP